MTKTELKTATSKAKHAIAEEIHLINEVYKLPMEVILHTKIAECKREMECAALQGLFEVEVIVPSYLVDEIVKALDEFNPELMEPYKLKFNWR